MKEKTPKLSEFKYGLIACTQSDEDKANGQVTVVHFCGYIYPPTKDVLKSLEEELNTDPEFNLVGRINKDVFIVEATDEMVKFYTSKKNNEETVVTIHEG